VTTRPVRRTGFFGFARPVEVVERPESTMADGERALVAEACTKSSVLWLKPAAEDRFHPAWHVWHQDAVHVVSGIGEQLLPSLTGPVDVWVPSKETGARVARFTAWGDTLGIDSPRWEDAAAALRAKRLNTREPEEQRARWSGGAMITRLEPLALTTSGSGTEDEDSGARPPAKSPATTVGRRPWHLRSRARGRWRGGA
jgi:hypothetical protein